MEPKNATLAKLPIHTPHGQNLTLQGRAPMKKTVVITGGSRGIGHAIALKFAKAGDNIVILTKDSQEIIKDVENQIHQAGGTPLCLHVDVSDFNALKQAVAQTIDRFGGIDILVNNTSTICLTDTLSTTPDRFDLMIATSARSAFYMSQCCIPHLEKSKTPHIINISPPMLLDAVWFKDNLAFSMSKYAMSLCTLGMAAEFKSVSINSLWPRTTIATRTIKDHFAPKVYTGSRWPSIMGDAAYELSLKKTTGQFFIDEAVLRDAGVTDFSQYAVDASAPLMQDFFVPKSDDLIPINRELFL
jgi:citronellol/citronellal dehydrogenase